MANGREQAKTQRSSPADNGQERFPYRLIEGRKRLSQSVLWDLQKQFYLNNGVAWWTERPVFAASDIPVCESLAGLVTALLIERQAMIDSTSPVYIVELGTGSGCSSYRFARALSRKLRSSAQLMGLKIRYVLTDIIADIVPVWEKNEQLRPLIEEGFIDCAVFDPSTGQRIDTSCKREIITADSFANMPIFIANSLFDTICIDGFCIKDGTAHEATINVSAPEQSTAEGALIAATMEMELKLGNELAFPYYEERQIDQLLREYVCEFPAANISVPIGALRIIGNLRRWTGDRMAMFIHSRGFTGKDMVGTNDGLAYNDLSFPLNFHALKRYFELCGGNFHVKDEQRLRHALAMGVISPDSERPSNDRAFAQFEALDALLQGVEEAKTAGDLDSFLDESRTTLTGKSSFQTLMILMDVFHCDPTVFAETVMSSLDALELEIPKLEKNEVDALMQMLGKVNENIYAFGRDLPQVNLEDEPLTVLIRVWRRAHTAWPARPTREFRAKPSAQDTIK